MTHQPNRAKPRYLYKVLKLSMNSMICKNSFMRRPARCKWTLGKWKRIEGELIECKYGFHAFQSIIDALSFRKYYLPDYRCLIARVEVLGSNEEEYMRKWVEKECCSEMRVVKFIRWTAKNDDDYHCLAHHRFESKYSGLLK